MKKTFFNLQYILLISLMTFFIAVFIGWKLNEIIDTNPRSEIHEVLSARDLKGFHCTYKFIDPQDGCVSNTNTQYTELEQQLTKLIEKRQQSGTNRASVYYKDLHDKSWAGVAEDEKYYPASLLKTLILITYLKNLEQNPNYATRKVMSDSKGIHNMTFFSKEEIQIGQEYTLETLVEAMIVNSDNQATFLLMRELKTDQIAETYKILGVDIETNLTSPKDYATYFTLLYEAKYLNESMSEKALELMTKSAFIRGIKAGVPDDILISHKYGESLSTKKQLHDCGIVHYPQYPYIICIMTEGDDMNSLSSTLQDISSHIYKSHAKRYAGN